MYDGNHELQKQPMHYGVEAVIAPHHKVYTAEYMGRGVKNETESLGKRHSKICCRHLSTTFTVDAGRDDSSGIARTLATREEAGDRNAL